MVRTLISTGNKIAGCRVNFSCSREIGGEKKYHCLDHTLYSALLSIKARIDGSLPRKSDRTSTGSFAPPGPNTCQGIHFKFSTVKDMPHIPIVFLIHKYSIYLLPCNFSGIKGNKKTPHKGLFPNDIINKWIQWNIPQIVANGFFKLLNLFTLFLNCMPTYWFEGSPRNFDANISAAKTFRHSFFRHRWCIINV